MVGRGYEASGVPYRDESQQLRLRVEQLEEQLDVAHRRIRDLEGAADDSTAGGIGRLLLGCHTRLNVVRTLDGTLDSERQDEVLEVLRRRFGVLGQASTVGKTLAWSSAAAGSSRLVEAQLTSRDGRVRIQIRERLGGLLGGVYGGVLGGVGGGGLGLIMPLFVSLFGAVGAVIAPVLWIPLVYAVVRVAIGGAVRKRELQVRGAVRELAELVEPVELAGDSLRSPRARVVLPEAQEEQQAEEWEAEAELEAAARGAHR